MSEQDGFTSPMASADASTRAGVWWRRLDSRLWAGRADDRPAGTIEQERRFVFVDLDGERHPGYRTLEAAQEAATGPILLPAVRQDQRSTRRRIIRLVAVLAAVVTVLVLVWTALRSVS